MEPKEQTKQINKTERDPGRGPTVAEGGVGELGEKGERTRKYRLVVTEQSWGSKAQHGKCSQ